MTARVHIMNALNAGIVLRVKINATASATAQKPNAIAYCENQYGIAQPSTRRPNQTGESKNLSELSKYLSFV